MAHTSRGFKSELPVALKETTPPEETPTPPPEDAPAAAPVPVPVAAPPVAADPVARPVKVHFGDGHILSGLLTSQIGNECVVKVDGSDRYEQVTLAEPHPRLL
jgi:hypothetical protein